MANTGTVTYSAEVIGNQTINVTGYTLAVSKTGDFPSTNYEIKTVKFYRTFRNTSSYNFQIKVNNSSGTIISQALDAQTGGGQESVTTISSTYYTNSNFTSINSLYLYGIDGSSGELKSGSYIKLVIEWQVSDVATKISSITSSVACGGSVTVSGTAAYSTYSHKLQVTFGDKTSSVVTIAAGSTAVSGSVSIDSSYANEIPSATSGTATAILKTYNGTTLVGQSTKTFTITVPNTSAYNPSVSITSALEKNSVTLDSVAYLLQNYSYLQLTASSTAKYGAIIKSLTFSGNGLNKVFAGNTTSLEKTATSSVFSNSGTLTYTITATDSRNRTVSTTTSVEVTPYNLPSYTTVTAKRCDSSQVVVSTGEGLYLESSASYTKIGTSNALFMKVEAKAFNGSYPTTPMYNGEYVPLLTPDITTYPFSNDTKYMIKVTFYDNVTSIDPLEIQLSSAEALMRWEPERNAFSYGCYPTGSNRVEIADNWGLYHNGYDTFTAPVLWSSDTGWASGNITVTNDFSKWAVIEAVLDTGATGTLTYNSDTDDKSFRGVCIDPVTNGFRAFAIKIHVDSTTQLTLTLMEKLSILSTGVSAYTAARTITKLIGIKHI